MVATVIYYGLNVYTSAYVRIYARMLSRIYIWLKLTAECDVGRHRVLGEVDLLGNPLCNDSRHLPFRYCRCSCYFF